MATKSVENGDFYNRLGAVSLMTAKFSGDGALEGTEELFDDINLYDGLNFRFNFTYRTEAAQGIRGSGSIGILGLNSETIRKWAGAVAPEEYRQKKRFVTVYAGYQSDGSLANCELFTAWISGGLPTIPPDMWLNFDVQDSAAALSKAVIAQQGTFVTGVFHPGGNFEGRRFEGRWLTGGGVTVRQACHTEKQKGTLGDVEVKPWLKWNIPKELEARLPRLRCADFSRATLEEAIALINSWGVVRASADLMDVPADPEHKITAGITRKQPVIVIDPLENFDPQKLYKNPIVLDQDAGVIGRPEFGINSEFNTVKVKCLMRHDIGIGDLIQPISKFMESPRKYYQVNEITYEGEYRGHPWYVTYKGIGVENLSSSDLEKEVAQAREEAKKDYGGSPVGESAADHAEEKIRKGWQMVYGKDA